MMKKKAARPKQGFTLMEVLIVIVVLGVLVGLAVPNYFRTVEKTRSNEAIANLKTIHMGQKIYRVDNNTFYGPSSSLSSINQNLNTDVTEEFYSLAITHADATTFEATASRVGGTKVFTIDETGNISESGSY